MKRTDCKDPFLRAYLDAALWTTDETPGQGDYVESGRAHDMFERLPADFIEQAKADCAKFAVENSALLEQAGDDEQNGHDLWLSRNRHGVGFDDRGYPDEIGDALQAAARKLGEHDLMLEDLAETEE